LLRNLTSFDALVWRSTTSLLKSGFLTNGLLSLDVDVGTHFWILKKTLNFCICVSNRRGVHLNQQRLQLLVSWRHLSFIQRRPSCFLKARSFLFPVLFSVFFSIHQHRPINTGG
jgi:hypothetical protein